MTMTVEFSGPFSQQTAEQFRIDFPEHQVVINSGMAGGRTIEIIGSFTKEQWQKLRAAVLRLLGAEMVVGLEVTKDGVKVAEMPAKRTRQTVDEAIRVLDKIQINEGD